MSVEFVSSSRTGASDSLSSAIDVPVPTVPLDASSIPNKYMAVVSIEQWELGDPVVAPPVGFTALPTVISASQKLKSFWKRLTAQDSGFYSFSWTGAQWNMGQCLLLSGAAKSGDPIEDFDSAVATSTNIPTTTVLTTIESFLINFIANESVASQTVTPTNFTNTQDANVLKTNYRIPGSIGSFSAANGQLSTSSLVLSQLIAIKEEPTSGGSLVASISDEARANMLADRVLAEPQRLSNTDLMSLVIADGAQTLVTKTDATAAVHLWRYLRQVRDT